MDYISDLIERFAEWLSRKVEDSTNDTDGANR